MKVLNKLLIFLFGLAITAVHAEHKVTNIRNSSKALSLRYISQLNLKVPFLGFGALEIGRDWGIGLGKERQHVRAEDARATLETALNSSGIKVVDTASSYHLSEQYIGTYAKRYPGKYIVITKPGESSILATDVTCKKATFDGKYCIEPPARYDFSRAAINRDIAQSLKYLDAQQLDIAMLHLDEKTAKEVLDKGEAVTVLKELKQAGKVRFIGVSLDNPELVKRCINSGDFDAVEFEFNLLNQSNQKNIHLAQRKGLGVFVRGGLGTGLLTSKVAPYLNDPNLPFVQQVRILLNLTGGDFDKLAALALQFLYEQEGISSALIGTKNSQHVLKNIKLLDNFQNKKLLEAAKIAMMEFYPKIFTNSVDAYFTKKDTKELSHENIAG